MKGKLTKIEELEPYNGSSPNGPYTLFIYDLTVDGKKYGVSDFNKPALDKKLESFLPLPCEVEFKTEKKGKFVNVVLSSLLKVQEKDIQVSDSVKQLVSKANIVSESKLNSRERALTLAVELTGVLAEGKTQKEFNTPVSEFVLDLANKFYEFLTK